MDSTKHISDIIRTTLHEWGYSDGDMIRPVDLQYAIWRATGDSTMLYSIARTCMQETGAIADFGDGYFMLNGESE